MFHGRAVFAVLFSMEKPDPGSIGLFDGWAVFTVQLSIKVPLDCSVFFFDFFWCFGHQ
jgi:hypothetical protein